MGAERPGDENDGPVIAVLPYAGAVRVPLSVVRAAAGPAAEVAGFSYPGHGPATGEPVDDVETLIDVILTQVRPLAHRRLVLLGFSMGGRLSFELARRLTEDGIPCCGLVICVARGPHTGVGHKPIAHLAPDAFATAAFRLGLVAPGLAGLPGADSLLRCLQADLRIVEAMPAAIGPPLTVPAAVVGATGDWLVPEPALRGWSDAITEPLQLRIPGRHLGWLEDIQPMTGALARGIAHVLAAPGQPAGERPARPDGGAP